MGKNGNSDRVFVFLGSKITVGGDCSHEIIRHWLHGRKVVTNLDSILRSRDITLPTKVCIVKAMVFPLVMYGSEKNWCFWTVVLEKTLEGPLDCKEIKSVNPKGKQSWIFTGRTDAEAEVSIPWSPDTKNWLIGKDSDAGKDWSQEEKGMTEMRSLDVIRDKGSVPGSRRPLDRGMRIYSSTLVCRSLMDKGAWWAPVHGVTKSQTRLSGWSEMMVAFQLLWFSINLFVIVTWLCSSINSPWFFVCYVQTKHFWL